MNCPSRTFDIDGIIVTRYYNTNKDVFGGKDYVDIITEPFYMTDFDALDKNDRGKVERFLSNQPTHYNE